MPSLLPLCLLMKLNLLFYLLQGKIQHVKAAFSFCMPFFRKLKRIVRSFPNKKMSPFYRHASDPCFLTFTEPISEGLGFRASDRWKKFLGLMGFFCICFCEFCVKYLVPIRNVLYNPRRSSEEHLIIFTCYRYYTIMAYPGRLRLKGVYLSVIRAP